MKISKLVEILNATIITQGDMDVVLWDLDSGTYFTFNQENIEFQIMSDEVERVSIGVNSYSDNHEPEPLARGPIMG